MGFHFVFAETPICNRRVQFSERCSTAGVANTATGNMQRQPPLQGVIKSQEMFLPKAAYECGVHMVFVVDIFLSAICFR